MEKKNSIQKSNLKISKLRQKLLVLKDKLQSAPKNSLFKPLYRIRMQRIANVIEQEKELVVLKQMYSNAYHNKYEEYMDSYQEIANRISDFLLQEEEMQKEIQSLEYAMPSTQNSHFEPFAMQNNQLLKQIPKEYRPTVDASFKDGKADSQKDRKPATSNSKIDEAQERIALLTKQLESLRIDRTSEEQQLQQLQEEFQKSIQRLNQEKKEDMALIKPNLWQKIQSALTKFAEKQQQRREAYRRKKEEKKAQRQARDKEKDEQILSRANKIIGQKSEQALAFEKQLQDTANMEKDSNINPNTTPAKDQSTLDLEADGFIPVEDLYGRFNQSKTVTLDAQTPQNNSSEKEMEIE